MENSFDICKEIKNPKSSFVVNKTSKLTTQEVMTRLSGVKWDMLPIPGKNKGERGQLLELAIGIPNSSSLTDLSDGELKTYTKGQSICITHLGHCLDDIIAFYGQSSDLTLKENVSTLDNPLAKVMQIRGTEYDWKEGNNNYQGHDIGVIAQEVEKVLPEAVSTKPDGTKGVHYNKLIPLLIEAVKDLSNKVDDIKDK